MKKVFIKQARLPEEAYKTDIASITLDFKSNSNKKYCPCHILKEYNPNKHRGCYECYKNHYICCDMRVYE